MNNELEILLIEDNEGDVLLTREAFRTAGFSREITVLRDGASAISYLKKEDIYSGVVTPDIILLDINLPKIDGREVLSFIKNDYHLKKIPVIILTTSDSEMDSNYAYENHANCYLIKPIGLSRFLEAIDLLCKFWFTAVQLPAKDSK